VSEQKTALVTGAGKGIGHEIAAPSAGASGSARGVTTDERPPWRSCARRVSTRSACRWTRPSRGAAIAIRLATRPDDGPTGGCFDDDGPVPW
jgi:NAD(P)-dependent dehydrogenase (short-subunit alcohol dehydrogenase family)